MYTKKMGTKPQSTSCSPPKQIKHSSPLWRRHVLLLLTCRIFKNHIFSPFLLWLTEDTKSYKALPGKHKDDQRGTKKPCTSMSVMKQDAMDIKRTTYAKYEWHTYGMQTIKTPTMKSKGYKNNFLSLKRIEQLLEKTFWGRKKRDCT